MVSVVKDMTACFYLAQGLPSIQYKECVIGTFLDCLKFGKHKIMPISNKENEMLKQLFLSTALAAAFAATPALADDHGKDKNQGDTQKYDNVDRDDKSVTPDKEAYDKNKSEDGNAKHPAHEMGEGDPAREQGQ